MRTPQQTAKQKLYNVVNKTRVEYNYLKDLQRELLQLEKTLLEGKMTYNEHNDLVNKIVRQKTLINMSKKQVEKLETKQKELNITIN